MLEQLDGAKLLVILFLAGFAVTIFKRVIHFEDAKKHK